MAGKWNIAMKNGSPSVVAPQHLLYQLTRYSGNDIGVVVVLTFLLDS